jgi:hypothetical protein
MIFSNRFLIMAQYNPAPEPPHPQLLSRLALSEEIDSCVIRKGRQRKLSVLVSVLVVGGLSAREPTHLVVGVHG